MPKTLYLSPRELATVIDALTLYAAEPDQLPPTTVRTGADRAFAAILAGYARRVALDTDTYDADRLRDQWYAHLRPDLTNPPAKTEAKP
jgi:hypothetical protein